MTPPVHPALITVCQALKTTENMEKVFEITGRSEDELTGVMLQISQVVAKQLSDRK